MNPITVFLESWGRFGKGPDTKLGGVSIEPGGGAMLVVVIIIILIFIVGLIRLFLSLTRVD